MSGTTDSNQTRGGADGGPNDGPETKELTHDQTEQTKLDEIRKLYNNPNGGIMGKPFIFTISMYTVNPFYKHCCICLSCPGLKNLGNTCFFSAAIQVRESLL